MTELAAAAPAGNRVSALGRDIRTIYGASWRFALVCPILFLVPVLFEFAQHVVEIGHGMYASVDGMRAAGDDSLRMAFGAAKVLSLLLPSYWFIRYLAFDESATEARRIDPVALRLWGVVFAAMAALQMYQLFGMQESDGPAVDGVAAYAIGAAVLIAITIISLLLNPWISARPLGNGGIGIFRSARIMYGHLLHAFACLIAAALPLMIAHYGLAFLAVGQPAAIVWALMTLDSLVVGFLALMLVGAIYMPADRAAKAKGTSLLPGAES